MDFEDPEHSVKAVLVLILIWAFGASAASLGIWAVTEWCSGGVILCIGLIPISLAAFWVVWQGSLHLKVELTSSPRQARCWRRNVLTRLKSERVYRIRDDAKVIVAYDGVGGGDGHDVTWPVEIEGLPKYYDFYVLGRGQTYDDAWAIGRTLASFLGIRFFDSKGNEHPVHDRGLRMWYGPRPDSDESPRTRRRRRRRRGA